MFQEKTAALARKLGLTLAELDDTAPLDLTIDSADEPTATNLIEVAAACCGKDRRSCVRQDGGDYRCVNGGQAGQISPAGEWWRSHKIHCGKLARRWPWVTSTAMTLRQRDCAPSDRQRQCIYDIAFGVIAHPNWRRSAVPGVVEHGLLSHRHHACGRGWKSSGTATRRKKGNPTACARHAERITPLGTVFPSAATQSVTAVGRRLTARDPGMSWIIS